ncbi:4-alpha-glucanotransferase [Candidatus Amarolinea dominans]|uniref:4-alpha-glucanotransferase n=1 Tax=Candidatus Amarolinea dominans TaxID=3140696 RepID=UPI001DC94358|nr:4-alpha-glucanotransferase [Anaerolineae bacterium]MBK7201641.1 4-alpha-glucanotransferase [Anaerolineae bacterium]MBK9232642.1 4-alpha-glucanotransferase [Anaerolineae bacterium]
MRFPRSSGVLLHPTSFPGPYGIGDLGDAAIEWIEFLARHGQQLWQVFPLGPTGYGDSPYQCFSAFAGNPLLISPDRLLAAGLLDADDLADVPAFPAQSIDFGGVIAWKMTLLATAFDHFRARATAADRAALDAWCAENAAWLDDYALFMAVKSAHGGANWSTWTRDIATRQPAALTAWRRRAAAQVALQKFMQFVFFQQWAAVKAAANAQGIRIIGDIPIFVAYDSADAWANPELFYFDENGQPEIVAGVPPDYFSETGQLWGNPLYRWDVMQARGYDWWLARIQATLRVVDIIRIDHFRGFEAYWAVPFGEPTAVNGEWRKAPGADLFKTVRARLGDLPIIAEDLGFITPEVRALRDDFGLPGMRIVQFAFSSGPEDPFLPHNYVHNAAVYTGTHDNDTSVGWYRHSSTVEERDFARRYLARDGDDIAWDFIRVAWASVADMALTPLQDLLSLDSEARMNFPGRPSGNWGWRYQADDLSAELGNRLLELTYLYRRLSPQPEKEDTEDTAETIED